MATDLAWHKTEASAPTECEVEDGRIVLRGSDASQVAWARLSRDRIVTLQIEEGPARPRVDLVVWALSPPDIRTRTQIGRVIVSTRDREHGGYVRRYVPLKHWPHMAGSRFDVGEIPALLAAEVSAAEERWIAGSAHARRLHEIEKGRS